MGHGRDRFCQTRTAHEGYNVVLGARARSSMSLRTFVGRTVVDADDPRKVVVDGRQLERSFKSLRM